MPGSVFGVAIGWSLLPGRGIVVRWQGPRKAFSVLSGFLRFNIFYGCVMNVIMATWRLGLGGLLVFSAWGQGIGAQETRPVPKSWNAPAVIVGPNGTTTIRPSSPNLKQRALGSGLEVRGVTVQPRYDENLTPLEKSCWVETEKGGALKIVPERLVTIGRDRWKPLGKTPDGVLLRNTRTDRRVVLPFTDPPR
jgi:hypothetical protein